MNRTNTNAVVGGALVALGALALLQNFGLLGALAGLLWAAMGTAGGLAFLGVYLRRPDAWWAAIPGAGLLGLAAVTAIGTLMPWAAGGWLGGLFLGSIGLGFCLVYAGRHEHWWAVIPAGVMLTLAAVAGLSDVLSGDTVGAVFFLGLALTFGALSRLPGQEERLRWALIPAGVMLTMSLVVLLATSHLVSWIVPAALILGGLAILYRNGLFFRREGSER
ncbi:MAG: hypothetical protein RLZZ387_4996 [Chloroflexota bacterium]|jgi:hypothetical protein